HCDVYRPTRYPFLNFLKSLMPILSVLGPEVSFSLDWKICDKDQNAIIPLSRRCRLCVIFVTALRSGSNELMLGPGV
ncbi:hypothetical protein, partial [Brevibacillus laterosporus]|uniref:hypothetical protein n=1 Tax=Brevibacillus laterosporus TaxID=1465 RepID=UPI001C3D4670